MSYIMDIRKHIGHDTMIAVGATTLVFNNRNQILLHLRTDTNTWGIPGGCMELYESIEENAIRELKEETNLDAKQLQLITVLSGKETYFEYPNGDKLWGVIVLFKVLDYTGDLKINDGESKELGFFSFDALPKLESRALVIINKIRSKEIIL